MKRFRLAAGILLALLMLCTACTGGNAPAEGSAPPAGESTSPAAAASGAVHIRTESAGFLENASLLEDGRTLQLTFSEPVTFGDLSGILAVERGEPILYGVSAPVVSVTDFGAIPDDDTDDIYFLQDAVDAVRDGGTVYFPAGEYLLSRCLIFYSDQTLYFEPGAVLKITDPYNVQTGNSQALLANDMDGTVGGYDVAKNVNIIGATFDGNGDVDYPNVMMNVCHIENLNVFNCTFRNGHSVHYFECNSAKNVRIIGCVFEDSCRNGEAKDEYLQIDRAGSGSYGTKYSVHGKHSYMMDNTPCENVLISDCIFEAIDSQVPAIGNHAASKHRSITIQNCTFRGGNSTRGIVVFGGGLKGVSFVNNFFSDCALGIDCTGKNSENVCVYESNVFERVDTPLQEGMTFTSGEGETVALPNYVRALSAVWTDGVEIDGKTYGKTVQVTFQSELPENADLILMLGSVRDAGGNALCMEQPPCPAAAAVAPVTKEG